MSNRGRSIIGLAAGVAGTLIASVGVHDHSWPVIGIGAWINGASFVWWAAR